MKLFSAYLLSSLLSISVIADPIPAKEKIQLPKMKIDFSQPKADGLATSLQFTKAEQSYVASMLGEYTFFGEFYSRIVTHLKDIQDNFVDEKLHPELKKKNQAVIKDSSIPMVRTAMVIGTMLVPKLQAVGMETDKPAISPSFGPNGIEFTYHLSEEEAKKEEPAAASVKIVGVQNDDGMSVQMTVSLNPKKIKIKE